VFVAIKEPRRDQQGCERQAVLRELDHPAGVAPAEVARHHIERDGERHQAEDERRNPGHRLDDEVIQLHLLKSFFICGP
jgi:hypothetical protein